MFSMFHQPGVQFDNPYRIQICPISRKRDIGGGCWPLEIFMIYEMVGF